MPVAKVHRISASGPDDVSGIAARIADGRIDPTGIIAIFGKTEVKADGTPASSKPLPMVDVEAMMEKLAKDSGRPSNWRVSIVDLMTLLKLDSSLGSRQKLAKELGYTGNVNDTAPMNIWLHKQVMTKVADAGGKIPSDIKTA